MTSAFENLTGPGKPLKAEPPDQKEFAGLRRAGYARLQDALNLSLSLESRFDLAYNAAHSLSLAALRWHGYRATNRYIVFQLLPQTVNLGPEVWRILSRPQPHVSCLWCPHTAKATPSLEVDPGLQLKWNVP